MISIRRIRENPEHITNKLISKNDDTDINNLLQIDIELRSLKTKSSDLRAYRNSTSEKIAIMKKKGEDPSEEINQTKIIGEEIKSIEIQLGKVEKEFRYLMVRIPNIPHDSTPIGKDASKNIFIRDWGKKKKYNFPLKNHLELGEALSLFDFKRGAKLSGSGFPLYVGRGAELERKLINAMLDHHIKNYGFKEILPSVLINKESMQTTGQLPKFQDDMYHTEVDNLYLAPTAEVPITSLHRNEVLAESELPIKYVGYTPCFRRESGSYGKDTRGLLRVHQFNKVELVEFTTPEQSLDQLEVLTIQAESVLQKLGLHYRVVELCTGDLSFSAAKCYDIEIWSPAEEKWLEVSSCSNFESFQARRGNIKYRRDEDKKIRFLHTINGSGLATPRLMVALIETYQNPEGIVQFPEQVASFLGIKELS
jgi:seryl-tRNA synthetase